VFSCQPERLCGRLKLDNLLYLLAGGSLLSRILALPVRDRERDNPADQGGDNCRDQCVAC
jgi:hypothetical protein